MTEPVSPEQRAAYEATVNEARSAYNIVAQRAEAAAAEAAEAATKLPEAIAVRDALVARAAAGEAVGAKEQRAAEDAAHDVESSLVFKRDVAARAAGERDRAHDVFARSHHAGAEPIAAEGAARLIDAARRRDKAVAVVQAIEAEMDAAAATVQAAFGMGFKARHAIAASALPWAEPVKTPIYLTAAEVARELATAGITVEERNGRAAA